MSQIFLINLNQLKVHIWWVFKCFSFQSWFNFLWLYQRRKATQLSRGTVLHGSL